MCRFVFSLAMLLCAATSVTIAQQEEPKPESRPLERLPGSEERPAGSIEESIRALREEGQRLRARLRELEESLVDPRDDGWRMGPRPWFDGGFWIPRVPGQEGWAFRDLERWAREMQRSGGGVQQHRFSLQVTPDGVRVEVQEKDAEGKEETRVYEADSPEAFKVEHPELMERLGLRFGENGWTFGSGLAPFPPLGGTDRSGGLPRELSRLFAQDTDRLGVHVSEPDETRVKELDLEEGHGLLVHEVQEGSLAARLGIKEDDVLISVNGQWVEGVDSVRRALRQVQEGSNVKVEVARPGEGRLTLEARKGPRDRRSV